jgi:molybdopterin molybdotransferase
MITPPIVGLLAAFGYARVRVYRHPRVAIVATGDELLAPSQPLRPGKIRDSNSYALAAAVRGMGIATCRVYRVGDKPSDIRTRLRAALRTSDVLLTIGGVSVGDRDHVRPILNALGVQEQFWRVAIKPGKPAYFGTFARSSGKCVQRGAPNARGAGLVFGLPGNPVSALVCFHQLVKPALLRMMGGRPQPSLTVSARLLSERRKPPGRLEWLRGCLSSADGELLVDPVSGQDSHMLGGLAKANCLIRFPQDADHLSEGTRVLVEFLSW